ncbi:hypothetical protein INR77_02865 [Erythrobacter sp. SCSIO 43205]|uniref:hypothetical protein n=1 Tax=Erythrobacter sp. SCSIO 43205 TaxID=2779361 RepID=UPI001CA9B43D|nr:hypothetical protein [Erythrobacter sp. SCSIO 43205]UAB78689.1 hypothetical protein INR77_02865 [Erythrobacter sp. SCSIO 43205]
MSFLKTALPSLAICSLALSACAGESEETTYEVDAEDVGGGELQISEAQDDAVPVDLPETPMKNVPAEGEGDMSETGEADE